MFNRLKVLKSKNRVRTTSSHQWWVLSVFLIICYSFLHGQPGDVRHRLDSLENKLKSVHDTDKFDIMYEMVYYYQNINLDTCLLYLQLCEKVSIKTKNKLDQATAVFNIAVLYGYKNQDSLALKNFNKALILFDKIDRDNTKAFVYHEIANYYWTKSNFTLAAENYLKELRLSEKLNDSNGIARALVSIGFIYEKSEEFDKALELYSSVLEIWTKLRNDKGIGVVLTNIGSVHLKKGNNRLALKFYQQALHYKQSYKDAWTKDVIYFNIAEAYAALKEFDSAKIYYLKALNISRKFGRLFSGSHINFGTSLLFYELGEKDSFIYYLTIANDWAERSGAKDILRKIYRKYSEYYAEQNDFNKAYHYLKLFTDISDSLQPLEARQRLAAYETEKIESKIDLLEKEKEIELLKSKKRKNQRNLLIIISLLILLITLIIYSRYVYRQRISLILEQKNKELEKANSTKDKFFAIIAHDLRNHLTGFQTVAQGLSENYENYNDARKHHLITRLHNSSSSLYVMMGNLLTWSASQLNRLEYQPEGTNLRAIVNDVVNKLQLDLDKKEQKLANEISEDIQVMCDINMISIVFRNLINNAIKFSEQGSVINVNCEMNDQKVIICITDFGIGISEEDQQKLFRIEIDHKSIGSSKEKGTGLGLILCKEFVEIHGGKIWVISEPDKGSNFYFNLDICIS